MADDDAQVTAAERPVDASVETSDDGKVDDAQSMVKAARQVEFYFADSNLPYDKFMWTLHTQNAEHWVPLETVASFKRMRDFKPHGLPWLVSALQKHSSELEIDEPGTKVRRTTEVMEPKGQFERSVYAKGFPDEDDKLQGRIEEFFAHYGKTNAVRMRRDDTKKFKGSVFAEFTDFKTVDIFLKAEPKPSFDGKELLIMSKEAYCDMKIKEKGLTGKAAVHRRELISSRGFNAFKEMKGPSAKNGTAATSSTAAQTAEKKDVYLEFLGSKILIHTDAEGNGTVKAEDVPFLKGSTLKFDGSGPNVSWSQIKDPIKEKFDGKSPYIKYSRGQDSGLVGFHKDLTEEEVAWVRETVKTLDGKDVTWSLVEEEEEKAFQIERAQAAAKAALSYSQSSRPSTRGGAKGGRGGRGGRGGGGRGGRGRGGKGGGSRRNNEKSTTEGDGDGGEQAGEKRKRAVEPDGGPDVGTRGTTGPPVLVMSSSAKKAKVDDVGCGDS